MQWRAWPVATVFTSESFDIALEVSHRETYYIAPSESNSAMVYHFRSCLKF